MLNTDFKLNDRVRYKPQKTTIYTPDYAATMDGTVTGYTEKSVLVLFDFALDPIPVIPEYLVKIEQEKPGS